MLYSPFPHAPNGQQIGDVALALCSVAEYHKADIDKECHVWDNRPMIGASVENTDPIGQLSSLFVIPDESAVRPLVEQDPDMVPALHALARYVALVDCQCRLSLGIFVDPEDEFSDHIVVTMHTHSEPRQAVRMRAKLYDQYWSDYLVRNGQRNIMLCLDYLKAHV